MKQVLLLLGLIVVVVCGVPVTQLRDRITSNRMPVDPTVRSDFATEPIISDRAVKDDKDKLNTPTTVVAAAAVAGTATDDEKLGTPTAVAIKDEKLAAKDEDDEETSGEKDVKLSAKFEKLTARFKYEKEEETDDDENKEKKHLALKTKDEAIKASKPLKHTTKESKFTSEPIKSSLNQPTAFLVQPVYLPMNRFRSEPIVSERSLPWHSFVNQPILSQELLRRFKLLSSVKPTTKPVTEEGIDESTNKELEHPSKLTDDQMKFVSQPIKLSDEQLFQRQLQGIEDMNLYFDGLDESEAEHEEGIRDWDIDLDRELQHEREGEPTDSEGRVARGGGAARAGCVTRVVNGRRTRVCGAAAARRT